MKLKPLNIGGLIAKVPIIQGGMGVGVSLSNLAGAVAKEGGIGVISAAHPGYNQPDFNTAPLSANLRALSFHINRAKKISNGGIIGVNIMCASRDYEAYVKCCVDSKADIIISGAGLPVKLPELLKGTNVKFAPIVSPLKSAQSLLKVWDRRYGRVSDFVVIEGPKAGGHLGYSEDYLNSRDFDGYDEEVLSIIDCVKGYEVKYGVKIPIIFAGGVFDRADIDKYMSLGADGVQMATRFVATEECDADIKFKMAYVNSTENDIVIVKSPVGMPGRALKNGFVKLREKERETVDNCMRCLEPCNSANTPYCISAALIRAVKGDVDNSIVFCGENAYRIDRIVTVKELFEELNS